MRKTGTDPTGSAAGDRRSGPMGKIFFFAVLALVVVSGLIFAPAESKLAIHPMDQFNVKPLFGGDSISWYTPTNVTLWMGLAVLAVFALLVLGSSRGLLMSVSPYDGEKLGSFEIDEPVYIAPIVAKGTLYVLTDDGDLAAFR